MVCVCVWADSRAVMQPTPSLCLCANAVLKWAHYHQREHKHSSRKQDSLCQEREPLPPAYCRPDDITSLKIRRWGSYYYCRHAPQAPTTGDNPTCFFCCFFSYCSMSSSKKLHGFTGVPSQSCPVLFQLFYFPSIHLFKKNSLTAILFTFPSFIYLSVNAAVRVWVINKVPPPHLYSPQNFFQIISNLLEEENKEKWEDAQKVSTALCTSVIHFAALETGRPGSGSVLVVSKWQRLNPT